MDCCNNNDNCKSACYDRGFRDGVYAIINALEASRDAETTIADEVQKQLNEIVFRIEALELSSGLKYVKGED